MSVPFDWASSILRSDDEFPINNFEVPELEFEVQQLYEELDECYILHEILWNIRQHRERPNTTEKSYFFDQENHLKEEAEKLYAQLRSQPFEVRTLGEKDAISAFNINIEKIRTDNEFKNVIGNTPRLVEGPAEIILRKRHFKWITSAMRATSEIIRNTLSDHTTLYRPTILIEALLRSSLSARAWPGLAMAVIPIAILSYKTLAEFCRQHKIDRAQLSRIQRGVSSFSVPRLEEIIDSIEWSPEDLAPEKDIGSKPRPIFLRLVYLSKDKFLERRSRPILGFPIDSLKESRDIGLKSTKKPMDLDQFLLWVQKYLHNDPKEFKRKAIQLPFHRTYLARVWRKQAPGSIDLLVWMAHLLRGWGQIRERGRIGIEGVRLPGITEPEQDQKMRLSQEISTKVLSGSSADEKASNI